MGLMKPDTHKVEVGGIKVKLERKEPILKQWLNRKKMKTNKKHFFYGWCSAQHRS